MSARDELEAVVWRALSSGGCHGGGAVDAILDAADVYALAVANTVNDNASAAAARREVLCQAVRETS